MNWEYWPMQLIYYPLGLIWLYFALKAKSLFFFNAANPSIKNGGLAMESKKEIYDLIPSKFIPETLFFRHGTPVTEILKTIAVSTIKIPFIVKPDIGMKGWGVQVIKDEIELASYVQNSSENFLIQELINYQHEIGIFYYRFPDQPHGKISGIVYKMFLTAKGNGMDTILQLVKQNHRSHFQLDSLKKRYGSFLNTILPKNEELILVPFGSHTLGSQFIDISSRANVKLFNTIDSICKNIDGFYFGRLDIRYSDWDDLCDGKNFSIIELNGAGSEPTHIYDHDHSLFFAWKEIIRHWNILYKISVLNFSRGYPYLSYQEGRKMLKANSKMETKLKMM